MPKSILAFLGKPKGGEGDDEAPPGESPAAGADPNTEVASSLREMFDLLKEGHDNEAAAAFKRAYELCADGGEGDDELDLGLGGDDEDDDEMEE